MRSPQHNQLPQTSPKTTLQPTIKQKKQKYNQFFTELLQKNQSLVQITDQQCQRTYEYPQLNVEKLRSNSSFRQFSSRDSNTNSNNSKIVNPIDVIKLKDILNANGKSQKDIQIDPQISLRISPKYNNNHLADLLSVNNKQCSQRKIKKPFIMTEFINQYQVLQSQLFDINIYSKSTIQEKILQSSNQRIEECQKENKNLDIETPRFYGMM